MPASLLLQLTLFTRLKFKNRLDIIYRTHLNQKFFSINCVDMDSIPWEKAQLAAEEKPHCVLGKNHPDGRERMGADGKATTCCCMADSFLAMRTVAVIQPGHWMRGGVERTIKKVRPLEEAGHILQLSMRKGIPLGMMLRKNSSNRTGERCRSR